MTGKGLARKHVSYIDALMAELATIAADYDVMLAGSSIINIDPNRGGNDSIIFVNATRWAWGPSTNELDRAAMALLGRLRAVRPRFELLFPHPTPAIESRHTKAFEHLERWAAREGRDKGIPKSIDAARAQAAESFCELQSARELLSPDQWAVRVVVDTNVLLDDPDLAQFISQVGKRYLVHLPTVVLRELDEHKRAGRNDDVRERARRADRRLKGLRDNGDVRTGARVAGDVWAIFEYAEPRGTHLPSWLDMDVPDDQFIASTLLLQSAHPGSTLVVATGDLNLQTKLAAAGLPFLEPSGRLTPS